MGIHKFIYHPIHTDFATIYLFTGYLPGDNIQHKRTHCFPILLLFTHLVKPQDGIAATAGRVVTESLFNQNILPGQVKNKRLYRLSYVSSATPLLPSNHTIRYKPAFAPAGHGNPGPRTGGPGNPEPLSKGALQRLVVPAGYLFDIRKYLSCVPARSIPGQSGNEPPAGDSGIRAFRPVDNAFHAGRTLNPT